MIERILMTDIHDEKDRDAASKLLQRKATIIYRKPSNIDGQDRSYSRGASAWDRSISQSNDKSSDTG